MIEHLVLFKLKPEVESERVEWILRETRIRLLKIHFVHGLRCGYRIDPKIEWPLFLLIELESEEKLRAYKSEPAYLRYLADVVTPHASARLELDFQSDPGEDPLLS
jgi:hypothetical protein